MDKNEFFASLRDVYCRLGPSKVHGVGVIAIRKIPKGADPLKNCDPHGDTMELPEEELEAYDTPDEAKKLVRDFCVIQDGVYYVPDFGIDAIDKSYFINHSKTPNMISPDKGETLIAARDIEPGEELTADYDSYNEQGKSFT